MSAFRENIYIPSLHDYGGAFVVEMAGITLPDPRYRISRGSDHFLYVIEYVMEGRGILECGEKVWHIQKGDAYLLQPGCVHKYFSDPLRPWKKIWFNIRGPLPEALCDSYSLRGKFYFPDAGEEVLEEMEKGMAILQKEEKNPEEHKQKNLALALVFHKLFYLLAASLQKKEKESSEAGKLMREYLEKNWRKSVTLKDLESLTGYSRAQILRIYKEDWQCTPKEYLFSLRLKNAKLYLENTAEAVKNIAERCGFQDEFYFSNFFKSKMGCSPALYRKKFRQEE